ncbi:MAG: glycoside hydrolase family 2 protein [Lachnospiraceae bacterium]|nr:glycoside hydrolase family 2 protein [Lachnospiraceae bacterium]
MRNIKNINKDWLFYKNTAAVPSEADNQIENIAETVNVPHTWNGIDGQDGGNDYFRGTCLYLKKMAKNEMPAGDKIYLEITGANSSAWVEVNGMKCASHDGGYSTWRVDVTSLLKEENEIAVFVDNTANETVYPQTADFTFYGGLYRDVNLIGVKESHFDLDFYGTPGVKVTPVVTLSSTGNRASVEVETFVTGGKAGQKVKYTLFDQEKNPIAETVTAVEASLQADTVYGLSEKLETASVKAVFTLENVHLWHGVKDPYLYSIVAVLLENETVVDQVSAPFGCRTFEIHPENGFILNGEEYPLRGVSRHQDRWEVGNALLAEHHVEDMDYICEMGANTIRLAHYQHDQFFYDLCDERGMVVWAEIPYISRHMPEANENTISQMKELIVQNYNHPSIVVWGLSNEITMDGAKDPDMIHNHKVLNDLVHKMDATRQTVIACITMCGIDEEYVHIPDVVSYNHYFGWYGGNVADNGPWFDKFHAKYPNTPIGVSEYGCEALNWHTSNPRQGDYTEEYQAYYHEELIKQLFTRKYIWATHVWNMFDFGADARAEGGENGQNHKGLMTIDRKYKKDAFYAYKAWLSDEPFVHLCGKRYIDRVEDVTKVTVYSNQPEVELFLNGESFGKKTANDHFFYFEVPNAGESILVAAAGECRDESRIHKVDQMNEDYILREKGAVLNWFDITEMEGRCSLNDNIGDVMKTLRGKIWFLGLFLTLAKKMSVGNGTKDSQGKDISKKQGEGTKKKAKKKNAAAGMNGDTMNLISGLSVLRFTSMLGMRNVYFTKEELLKMNGQLNKIKKVNK